MIAACWLFARALLACRMGLVLHQSGSAHGHSHFGFGDAHTADTSEADERDVDGCGAADNTQQQYALYIIRLSLYEYYSSWLSRTLNRAADASTLHKTQVYLFDCTGETRLGRPLPAPNHLVWGWQLAYEANKHLSFLYIYFVIWLFRINRNDTNSIRHCTVYSLVEWRSTRYWESWARVSPVAWNK